jgi:hypothetical protein
MIVYRVDPYTEDQRIESKGYPSGIETVVNLEDTIVPVLGWYGDDVSVYSINIAGLRTTEYHQKPYMVEVDKFDHRFLNVIRIMEAITPDRITKVGEWEYNPQTKDFDYEEM